MIRVTAGALVLFALGTACLPAQTTSTIALDQDDKRGTLRVSIGERELFTYNYSDDWALPHFFPMNSPSGKNLLVEKTEPYPHHRAFWVADTVVRDGVKGDVYNSYYSGRKKQKLPGKPKEKREYKAPFNTASRHLDFVNQTFLDGSASIQEDLVWETSRTATAFPLLSEHRKIKIYPLSEGEYFMDFAFTLTADFGDVQFVSDAVHYAWPFLRINTQFSPEGGGTLSDDRGTTGQASTNLKPAKWIDYSNKVDGTTEGVTVFQWPDGGPDRLWLTRDYGTFGPRRPPQQSGVPFTLKRGGSLSQRVGIYVHNGNAAEADLRAMRDKFVQQKLP